jgi:aspartyl/asparaginyl-tRNA synthetase
MKIALVAHALLRRYSVVDELKVIKGWVRTVRSKKNTSFISLSDGVTLAPIQVVAPADLVSG